MTRKNANILIGMGLLIMPFASPLFALNIEMSGETGAARAMIPMNLPQNDFSIEEIGTVPNLPYDLQSATPAKAPIQVVCGVAILSGV